jgi:hypothetical protein
MEPTAFLQSLKVTATSPYAFVGYVCVVAAWLYTVIARHRLNTVSKHLKDLPEARRAEVLLREYNTTPRAGLSAEQWIKARQHTLFFLAFIATLVTVVAIAGIAWSRSSPGNEENPPFEDPVDVTTPSKTSGLSTRELIYARSFRRMPSLPRAELKNPTARLAAKSRASSHEASGSSMKQQGDGLELVQIIEERSNKIESQRLFDVTLANKSQLTRVLKSFEVSWSYISAGGAGIERPYVLKPQAKYVVELPLEVSHPNGSKIQPLNRSLVVPPGSESEPNLVSLRLLVYYRLVDARDHPTTNWDIIFNISILDNTGARTTIFADRRWKDRP